MGVARALLVDLLGLVLSVEIVAVVTPVRGRGISEELPGGVLGGGELGGELGGGESGGDEPGGGDSGVGEASSPVERDSHATPSPSIPLGSPSACFTRACVLRTVVLEEDPLIAELLLGGLSSRTRG